MSKRIWEAELAIPIECWNCSHLNREMLTCGLDVFNGKLNLKKKLINMTIDSPTCDVFDQRSNG